MHLRKAQVSLSLLCNFCSPKSGSSNSLLHMKRFPSPTHHSPKSTARDRYEGWCWIFGSEISFRSRNSPFPHEKATPSKLIPAPSPSCIALQSFAAPVHSKSWTKSGTPTNAQPAVLGLVRYYNTTVPKTAHSGSLHTPLRNTAVSWKTL